MVRTYEVLTPTFKTKYAGNVPDHEAKVRGAAYIGGFTVVGRRV